MDSESRDAGICASTLAFRWPLAPSEHCCPAFAAICKERSMACSASAQARYSLSALHLTHGQIDAISINDLVASRSTWIETSIRKPRSSSSPGGTRLPSRRSSTASCSPPLRGEETRLRSGPATPSSRSNLSSMASRRESSPLYFLCSMAFIVRFFQRLRAGGKPRYADKVLPAKPPASSFLAPSRRCFCRLAFRR